MTIKQAIKKYSNLLKNVTHIPQKEVEMLILHILDKNVIWLHLNINSEFKDEKKLEKLVKKRATDYPMEYILGKASFYGEMFLVEEGVLIPRPETEILVEKAELILKDIKSPNIIEIGVGSGIIAVSLAKMIPDITITAVDINPKALALARKNAVIHGVEDKITFIEGSLFDNIPDNANYDMCISNPPYIADDYEIPKNVGHEPKEALFGGEIGDELLKEIIDAAYKRKIRYLLCEMGYDQKNRLNEYIKRYNPKFIEFYKDYSDFDRGFIAEFN